MVCGAIKPHIPKMCRQLFACANQSCAVVSQLLVVLVSNLNTDTVHLGNLLLEVTNAEVTTYNELTALVTLCTQSSQCLLVISGSLR